MSGFPPPPGGGPYNSFPRMGGMQFRPAGNFGPNMMGHIAPGNAPPPGMPGMPRLGGTPMAGHMQGRPGHGPGGFPAPMGASGAPPPLLPEAPIGPKPASTVYVGKIAASIPDEVVRELLEACGSIKSWNPVKEPSGASKGFGFCEYEDADGALRALRLLHNLAVDGQELLLKPNTATQKYLVWYEQQKEVRRRRQQQEREQRQARKKAEDEAKANGDAAAADGDAAAGEGDKPKADAAADEPIDEAAQEQATDDLALTIIMGIVSNRKPPVPDEAAAEKKDERRSSHRDEERSRHSSPGAARDRSRPQDTEAAREAAMEAEFDRERQRQRAMQEDQRRREEREFQRRLDLWERHERARDKEREREKDRQRDMERERARYVKADLEGHDSDGEREPWQRRSLRHSRRMEERRKRRERELQEDAADRAKDEAEQAEALPEAPPSPEANGAADIKPEQDYPADGDTDMDAAAAAVEAEEEAVKQEVKQEQQQREEDDPIFQAMQAAAFSAAPAAPSPQPHQQPQPQQPVAQPSPQQQLPPAAVARPAAAGKRGAKVAVSALFGDDEEESTKKRKLVPINYTADEIKAVQDHTQALSEAAAQAAAAAGGGQQQQQQEPQQQPVAQPQEVHHPAYPTGLDLSGCKSFLRQWMDTLPNTREPLYTFPVRWEFMGEGSLGNIGAWVTKKVPELVGMEEPDLVEFIMGHVRQHAPTETMESELSPILMQDTVGFVMKLKRLVIYECERSALQKRFS